MDHMSQQTTRVYNYSDQSYQFSKAAGQKAKTRVFFIYFNTSRIKSNHPIIPVSKHVRKKQF